MNDAKYMSCALELGEAVYNLFLLNGRSLSDDDLFPAHDLLKHMWFSMYNIHDILRFGADALDCSMQEFDENFELSVVFDKYVDDIKSGKMERDLSLYVALQYVDDEDERVFVL